MHTTNQPNTKSIPNPNPNLNPTTKHHAVVSIELNIVTCTPTYPEKFIRDNVVALFLQLSVVIVTLPCYVMRSFIYLFIIDIVDTLSIHGLKCKN